MWVSSWTTITRPDHCTEITAPYRATPHGATAMPYMLFMTHEGLHLSEILLHLVQSPAHQARPHMRTRCTPIEPAQLPSHQDFLDYAINNIHGP